MKLIKTVMVILAITLTFTEVHGQEKEECLEMMISADDKAEIIFKAEEKSFPVPEIIVQGNNRRKMKIHFSEPGTYSYKIFQESGDSIYEHRAYCLTVFAELTCRDELRIYSILTLEGSDLKEEEIVFLNEDSPHTADNRHQDLGRLSSMMVISLFMAGSLMAKRKELLA